MTEPLTTLGKRQFYRFDVNTCTWVPIEFEDLRLGDMIKVHDNDNAAPITTDEGKNIFVTIVCKIHEGNVQIASTLSTLNGFANLNEHGKHDP